MSTEPASTLSKKALKSVDKITTGQLLPQLLHVEQDILGVCLAFPAAFAEIELMLDVDHFYDFNHQIIFTAMKEVWSKNKSVNLSNVFTNLMQKGLSKQIDIGLLSNMQADAITSARIQEQAAELVDTWRLRKYILNSIKKINQAYAGVPDALSFLDEVDTDLRKVMQVDGTRDISAKTRTKQTMDRIASAYAKGFSGTSWGDESFDAAIGGIQPGSLIVIAGRTSMGKTALAVWISGKIAAQGLPVMVFNIEMKNEELGLREAAIISGVPYSRLSSGDTTKAEYLRVQSVADKMEQSLVSVDEVTGLSFTNLRSKMYSFLAQNPTCPCCIIDHLGLMDVTSGNKYRSRENEVAELTRNLKKLSKELNIAVIILCQLNREMEKHGASKKPLLSNLRESGAIEQDADIVIFPYRAEYYGKEIDEDDNPTAGRTEIIVAKNRQGRTLSFHMKSDMGTNSYWTDEYKPFKKLNYYRDEEQSPF